VGLYGDTAQWAGRVSNDDEMLEKAGDLKRTRIEKRCSKEGTPDRYPKKQGGERGGAAREKLEKVKTCIAGAG